MPRIVVALPVLVLLLVVACAPQPPANAPQVVGEWSGRIELPGAPLEVGIRLAPDGDRLRGEIDIPAQRVRAMPLADVRQQGAELTFRLPEVPGDAAYRGAVAPDGASITGEFTQFGRAYALVLRPGPPQGRPQDPRPPHPYRVEDVAYRGDGVDLAGTLTAPEGAGPFPAVLLTTGSGPQDRDEQLYGHKPFLVLADALTRAGYAVLRVDDRGVGGSGGELTRATYDALAGDVVAGVEFLRGRPEIDPARVGLLGHSEGGYLVPMAAERADVAFAVLLAGPAVPGDEVLLLQNRLLMEAAGAPAEQIAAQVGFVRELVGLLRAEDYAAAHARAAEHLRAQSAGSPPEQRPTPELIERQAASTATPYFREWVVHDPAPSLRALDVPVLAIYGGKDLQVPATQNEPAMRALLAGSPDSTVETLPGLNHLMQPATTGGIEEYATIDTTIDPQVLDLVTGWLRQRFPA